MVKFEKVTKRFGSIVAVEDVSFVVDRGEFVFLTGRSGAGKTTLMRLLLREIIPASGKIIIDDRDLATLKSAEIPFFRRRVGVVFQDFKLLAEMTVYENVALAAEIDGKVTESEEKRIKEALEKVGMSKRAHLFPRQLSGGEAQRAVIARVLVAEPKIILADEPTGNVDPSTARQILHLLDDAAKKDITVIMATHNAPLVNLLRRRVITLRNGKLVGDQKSGRYAD